MIVEYTKDKTLCLLLSDIDKKKFEKKDFVEHILTFNHNQKFIKLNIINNTISSFNCKVYDSESTLNIFLTRRTLDELYKINNLEITCLNAINAEEKIILKYTK